MIPIFARIGVTILLISVMNIATACGQRNSRDAKSDVAFAVPINQAHWIARQLLAHGRVPRGQLGVQIQPLTFELRSRSSLPDLSGIYVSAVVKDSAAERAGLEAGDVIISFADKKVQNPADLLMRLDRTPINSKRSITLWQRGEMKTMEVEVAEAKTRPVRGPDRVVRSDRPEGKKGAVGFRKENQFVEVVNNSTEEVMLLVPDLRGGLTEAGRVRAGTTRRLVGVLPPGRRALAVEFTKDGFTINSSRLEIAKHGYGYLHGKRVTINAGRKMNVKSVRYFDGPWTIQGNNITTEIHLDHFTESFGGTIDVPKTTQAMSFSGTFKDRKVKFLIYDPKKRREGRAIAELTANKEFDKFSGVVTLTVVYDNKEYSTSYDLVISIDDANKKITIHKLEKKQE